MLNSKCLFALIAVGLSIACSARLEVPEKVETPSGGLLYFSWPKNPGIVELVRMKKKVAVAQCGEQASFTIFEFYPAELKKGEVGVKMRSATPWESAAFSSRVWLREQGVSIHYLCRKYADCTAEIQMLEAAFNSCAAKLGDKSFDNERAKLEHLMGHLEPDLKKRSGIAAAIDKKYEAWKSAELDRRNKEHLARVQNVVTRCRVENERSRNARKEWRGQKIRRLLAPGKVPSLIMTDKEIVSREEKFLEKEFGLGLESCFDVGLDEKIRHEDGVPKPCDGSFCFKIVPDTEIFRAFREYARSEEKCMEDFTELKLSQPILGQIQRLFETAQIQLHMTLKDEFGETITVKSEKIDIPLELVEENASAVRVRMEGVPDNAVGVLFELKSSGN